MTTLIKQTGWDEKLIPLKQGLKHAVTVNGDSEWCRWTVTVKGN